jgi:transposase-like protein
MHVLIPARTAPNVRNVFWSESWRLSQAERNAVAQLYRQGAPVKAIAAHFGITHNAVNGIARRRGIARRIPLRSHEGV